MKKNITSDVWNDSARNYGVFIHERAIMELALRKIFLEENLKGKTIADIGCGTGIYSNILANEFDCKVFGFDVSLEMIDIAKARILHKDVLFQVTDANKLPLQDKSVDAVLMSTLISNLKSKSDIEKVFLEARRILKPDGLLIITTPHPCFETKSFPDRRVRSFQKDFTYFSDGDAYSLELFKEDGLSVDVVNYHWTLETQIRSIIKAGFLMYKILEPEPAEPLGEESRYPVYLIMIGK